jgi:hypothetical protein
MNAAFSASARAALLFWQERHQAGASERARLSKKAKPLRDLFGVRERVLSGLHAECDVPVPKDTAQLIALRMALFCESDASRVLRALSWAEDRDVMPVCEEGGSKVEFASHLLANCSIACLLVASPNAAHETLKERDLEKSSFRVDCCRWRSAFSFHKATFNER